eukprot:408704_1
MDQADSELWNKLINVLKENQPIVYPNQSTKPVTAHRNCSKLQITDVSKLEYAVAHLTLYGSLSIYELARWHDLKQIKDRPLIMQFLMDSLFIMTKSLMDIDVYGNNMSLTINVLYDRYHELLTPTLATLLFMETKQIHNKSFVISLFIYLFVSHNVWKG